MLLTNEAFPASQPDFSALSVLYPHADEGRSIDPQPPENKFGHRRTGNPTHLSEEGCYVAILARKTRSSMVEDL